MSKTRTASTACWEDPRHERAYLSRRPRLERLTPAGHGPVQQSFLDLVKNTRDYVGYHPDVVWGNLQTPQYAAAMLRLVIGFH